MLPLSKALRGGASQHLPNLEEWLIGKSSPSMSGSLVELQGADGRELVWPGEVNINGWQPSDVRRRRFGPA
jgi:hypothetical protein